MASLGKPRCPVVALGSVKSTLLKSLSLIMEAREPARAMILHVLRTTGITATAGIGTNLYLCKVAMDIMAKHVAPDESGVRIAELDKMSTADSFGCTAR